MKRKIQVFISSTYLDLKSERQAAVSAILKAGHIPAGMELFTAGDENQLDVIKRWIDESDAYMLILGGRYGSTEPNTGLSYTELEFDYAMAQGKPLFSVLLNEAAKAQRVKDHGASVIETVNPDKMRNFEKKVLGQLCAFFDDEKDIRLAILEKMLEFAERRDLRGWLPADKFVDTQPLQSEVERLKAENLQLSKALDERKISESANLETNKISKVQFESICRVLKAQTFKLNIKKGESVETPLETLQKIRNILIKGVDVGYPSAGLTAELEETVLPLLMTHGLLDRSPIRDGVRYQISDKGLAFLEMLDLKAHDE